jgi:hypothetical protein
MNIKPVAGPGQVPVSTQPSPTQQSAKARAVAMLSGQTPGAQPTPQVVSNQNAISAEEMGAVRAPSEQATEDSLHHPAVPEPNVDLSAEADKPAEDPRLSRQFAQLARQERALRQKQQQQEQAYKARESELSAREAKIAEQEAMTRDGYISRDQLKTQTLQTLIDEGITTYDALTQDLLNSSSPLDPRIESQMKKQASEIQRLQKLIDERDTNAKQAQQTQYDAAVKQIRQDAQSLVKNDPNFESIRATGSVNDVVDLIVKTFNEDGILMPVEEAAEEVENYLVEEALKLSRLSKVQKRLSATAKPQEASKPATPAPAQTQAQSAKPTMKTLTNATGSTRPLSARERAVLAFRGELK